MLDNNDLGQQSIAKFWINLRNMGKWDWVTHFSPAQTRGKELWIAM